MGPSTELYGALAGIAACTAASSLWWRWKSVSRKEQEEKQLERSLPTSRDGLLMAALVVDVWNDKGQVSSHEPWLGDLWVLFDGVVSRHGLKKVASYQSTYMVASTEQRIAEEALLLSAHAAIDLRDAFHMFVAARELTIHTKFGIHADIIPTVGLGSTVALSQMWNEAMELAENARPNSIELSKEAAEWLGPEFKIENLDGRPILQARWSA